MNGRKISRVLLPLVCTLTVIGIVSAGLWPFHAPRNAIRWRKGGGLVIGEHGAAMTTIPFEPVDARNQPCSLELWIKRDAAKNDGTILAFFRPDNFLVLFALRQSLGDLELRLGPLIRRPRRGTRVYADDILRRSGWIFLTITSGSHGTKVYSDGRLVAHQPEFKPSIRDLTGRLMIGNAPGVLDSWSGQIRSVAIYSRELSADEVVSNYTILATDDVNALIGTKGAIALFPFREDAGNVVRNQIDTKTDIHIPDHFFVLNKPFLEAPWDEFYMGWRYWANLALNIIAFVPLGCVFCALFWSMRTVDQRLLATITVGFAVSLTIEVLQWFLPTRKSGVTDLISNTLGAALGAVCCRWGMMRDFDHHITEETTSNRIR